MPPSRKLLNIGLPQIASLALLLVFVAQCLWFMAHVPITEMESSYIEDGMLHVDRLVNASSEFRSPLIAVLAGFPAKAIGGEKDFGRLKGLGEMDAEELRDTTMDALRRTLLQVTVEEAALADDIVSQLMGDDVELRKHFIQTNAKDVRFLDI